MPEPSTTRTLLWFRRNLRVDDQPLFAVSTGPTVEVWVLDPRELLADDPLGFPRCGGHRLRFVLDSVADLRASLRKRGTDLIVRVGEPEAVLPELVGELQIDCLRLAREPGTEERSIEKRLIKAVQSSSPGTRVDDLPPETLFAIDDPIVHARELPEVFSKWRRRCEKRLDIPAPQQAPKRIAPIDVAFEPGDVPTLADLGRDEPVRDERAALTFPGGERAALDRLHAWAFEDDRLHDYKETRNGLLGESYSSKLSPWLALGCVSSRRVAERTLAYEAERVSNDSTYWLRFELMWRDYFRLYLLKHGKTLFQAAGPQDIALNWSNDRDRFEAWHAAKTGIDFVDANMLELDRTGFMSNRGRQNVASFLAKNLGIDWRWGARWFESRLIDYCPAANWGNWAYNAGVGADPRGFRGFNIASQARRYDPDKRYVRHWLGERGGQPRPIVDLDRSLADAESRWQAATRSERYA